MSLVPRIRPRRHTLPFLPGGFDEDPETYRLLQKMQSMGMLNGNRGIDLALQQ